MSQRAKPTNRFTRAKAKKSFALAFPDMKIVRYVEAGKARGAFYVAPRHRLGHVEGKVHFGNFTFEGIR